LHHIGGGELNGQSKAEFHSSQGRIQTIHRKEGFRVGNFWYVSIDIVPCKYVKTFSDPNCGSKEAALGEGSKEAALGEAIEYQDNTIRKEGLILVENRRVHNNRKSTNKSGIKGVSRNHGDFYAYIQVDPYIRIRERAGNFQSQNTVRNGHSAKPLPAEKEWS
jgi:hypothetical protein